MKLILLRKRHRIACRTDTGRNDRNGVNRSHIREDMEQNRMTRLMVCGNLLIFLGNHLAALLSTDSHFNKGFLNIRLGQELTSLFCGIDRRLIHQVFQIGSGKSSGCLRDAV